MVCGALRAAVVVARTVSRRVLWELGAVGRSCRVVCRRPGDAQLQMHMPSTLSLSHLPSFVVGMTQY